MLARNSEAFFTQAAGHPPIGFTQFITKDGEGIGTDPVGVLRNIRVDLPTGLSVNPQARRGATSATFLEAGPAGCPAAPWSASA